MHNVGSKEDLALSNLVAPPVEKAFQTLSVTFRTITLSLDLFSERICAIIKGSFDKEQLRTIIAQKQRNVLESFIMGLKLEDLFLATACATGDNAAWEIFVIRYRQFISKTAHYCCKTADDAFELVDAIMSELFIPRGCSTDPAHLDNKIASYNGRGSLQGWLRAVISRASIDSIRFNRKFVQFDSEDRKQQRIHFLLPNQAEDGHILQGAEQALEHAFQKLDAEEKLLLNYYYFHDLSLKEIAIHFKVHEATICRWLDRIRKKIKKSVENVLKKEIGVKDAQLKDLWDSGVQPLNVDIKSIIKQDDS